MASPRASGDTMSVGDGADLETYSERRAQNRRNRHAATGRGHLHDNWIAANRDGGSAHANDSGQPIPHHVIPDE